MHDVSTKSQDFFEREVRVAKRVAETINKSISANVPPSDQAMVKYYLWKQVSKLAASHSDDIRDGFIKDLDLAQHEAGFNGPVAAGEYAVLELQVRKGGKSVDRRKLNNTLRKRGISEADAERIIEESSVERAPSKILTVKPKV